MTTDKEHMDTTGAEANKPENEAAANEQNAASPKSTVAEDQTPATGQGAPKEEQPEVQPALTTPAEEQTTEEITEAFAAANTDVKEEEPATAPQPTAQTTADAGSAAPAKATAAEEHHDEEEEEEEDHTDYSQLSLEELRQQLSSVLKDADAMRRFRSVNELHRHYDLKFQAERNEALDKFKEEGGTEEDFAYHTSKEHQDLEQLLSAYRESRYQQRQSQEQQRQSNLERKKALLNQLRQLVEAAETKNSGDELKKLQTEWKSIGPVPAGEAQELWDSYHALLDIFYNNRSMFFEMKELDRKRNLEAKLQLVERAQALQEEPSINKALQELRHLHEEWKNIGPVPNEQRDPIWEQFIQASEKVHERRRAYHEERSTRELQNLTVKRGLLERLQEFSTFNTDRINEWRDKTDEIQKLKEEWDNAGLVPKEYAEEVNKTFWGNYKAFFQHKNQFFKALDEQKNQNLQLKTQLCEEAESLKDSTDWGSTKEKLIQLQKKWKTIGRVPDKHSDKIWQRFRAACNQFFDRKQENEQQRSAELEKLSAEKMEICDKVADKLSQPPSATGSVEEFNSLVQQWRDTDKGAKRTSPKAEDKFISLMEKYLERVPELTLEERSELLVKLQVERIKHSPDASHKLHQRENTLRREISQLQNDIQTLRTNIEFFARSKNADKLREEYEGRIADAQKRIAQLQHQLDAFRG
ncbi:DUF349 domain-containing protein [Pontibacter actiniarum]|uniref:DUF349 domain-containing protein n=1 Tax=Pontibacter actiniarum TaxID=323450 RepID=A0A1X9YQ27_9BACT|nr:DUF349 domain-containing protein [Pontibacter actiniarum]ARS34952.1 hypothetical protein CA264_05575 [Pontibacter actiniarum]